MILNNRPKRGDRIEYSRPVMFKGTESVVATVVAVNGRSLLLDNGDTVCFLVG